MGKEYKNLIMFLLIAFLLPLAAIACQSMVSNDLIRFVLYGMQAAAPTISAVIVLCLNKKATAHFMRLFRKERLKTALILPIMIACSTMVLAKLIYCAIFRTDFVLGSISTTQFIIILWAFVAEEIGWRGYLEPLLKMYGIRHQVVPCIIGMVWCLWHYHFFLQNSIAVPIPLFFISCIIESYIYSFLMRTTNNNIVSAMTYHFAWNLFIHIAAITPADNNGSIFPYIILVVLEALLLPGFLRVV